MHGRLPVFIVLALLLAAAGCAHKSPDFEAARELALLGVAWTPGPAGYQGAVRESRYLTMRDGTRIAVDVYLPEGLDPGARLPAIIRATRYWRRWDFRPPFSWFMNDHPFTRPFTELFTGQGYAVVHVDARGSGASFGVRPHPWSEDEVRDYHEIIDWIVAQPWSNGRVGAQGISYDGTAAEFMALDGHPALKAACVRFALYDVYADIAFPGGVLNERFIERWGAFNGFLDQGRLPEGAPLTARLAVAGPGPVDGPEGEKLRTRAQAEHEDNLDIYKAALSVEYRDQKAEAAGVPVDAFSPHASGAQGRVPILAFGGWLDGAYADALLKRYMLGRSPQRAILGAWNHAGIEDADPWNEIDAEPEPGPLAQLFEMLRFFDYHLKGLGELPREEVVFKVMGSEAWLSTRVWPPEGLSRMRLGLTEGGGLVPGDALPGAVDYSPECGFRTGGRRWLTQLTRGDVFIRPEVWEQGGYLAFRSDPLARDTVVAGSPVLDLVMRSSRAGAALAAYLLAVGPDDVRVCLTEGHFRPIHRALSEDAPPQALDAPLHSYRRADCEPLLPRLWGRVSFGLISTAIRVPAGYRLELVLAGGDASQFKRYPELGRPLFTFMTGPEGSFLEIPVLALEPH